MKVVVMKVYLSIGSNLGDRAQNCHRAVELMNIHPDITVLKISQLLETKALTLDNKPQPDYLNGVLEIQTSLTPYELLKVLKSIEQQLGRKTEEKRWQPRPIDLDILLFGNQTMKTPELTIPHPEIRNREFLVQTLKEIGVADETIYR